MPWLLPLSAAAALTWVLGSPPRSMLRAAGVACVLLGTVLGFAAHGDLLRYGRDWDSFWSAHRARVDQELDVRLTALWEAAERAADLAAAATDSLQGRTLDERVHSIRRQTGMAALAVYDADGRLVTWDGTHRGKVPPEAYLGIGRFTYGETTLFSYLYSTAPLPRTGGTAVAAALLRAELPPGLTGEEDDFASNFKRATGESIRIFSPDRTSAEPALDFRVGDQVFFSLAVVRPVQAERRAEARRRWAWLVGAALTLSWLLLVAGGYGRPYQLPLASASILLLAGLVPLDALSGGASVAGAAEFLLPGPLPLTLLRLLALSLAGTVVAGLTLGGRGRGPRSPALSVGVPVAVLFPLTILAFTEGVSSSLLAGAERPFLVFEVTLALVLTLVAYLGLWAASREEGPAWADRALLFGVALPPVLVGAAVLWVRDVGGMPWWAAVLWALPALLIALGNSNRGPARRRFPSWSMAVLLGSTAGLTFAWSARTEARIGVGETRLKRLAQPVDPYLEFLLYRFGDRARVLDRQGADAVEVLYRGWVDSGLAEEGYPVWLTVWSPLDMPNDEFRLGVSGPRPPAADDFLTAARTADTVALYALAEPDANYVATVPLSEGAVATVVVPPRPDVSSSSPLSTLFSPVADPGQDALTLVPLLAGDIPTVGETPRWSPSPDGWTAEMLLATPGQSYHVHYTVGLASSLILSARASLVLFLNLVVFVLVWGLGRLMARGVRRPFRWWRVLVTSFRARLTLALFAFFLLSIAIFGTLAFGGLSTATERAAEVLARRATDEAATFYNEAGGGMELLARQVGSELVEYRGGALRVGSVEELVSLGLYEGWVPLEVYYRLGSREALLTVGRGSLGDWQYITSYRRLPDGDIMAAPVSLQAGAIAVRRREVLDLLGFAALMGAALSLGLALLVGRTLALPILTLQVASERVGAGNLRLQLPEDRVDEFGSVFVAFNRMVERLRKARRELVRTTRRTQAIVDEAATGVVALDASGRVTLVNPSAEALLGRGLPVGEHLTVDGGAADALVAWIDRYFRDGVRESATDLQLEDRRIRVRARRISRRGPLGGAVLSLEDVTDELRTERILAWGEMAQQVAHEVKNPLTPIKLSVQHIRRAWTDRRTDFSDILSRNVEAILTEIDRLASIARSFSRFGAPRAAGEDPLEPVSLEDVVVETLALYEAGEGVITFEAGVAENLPPVTARESELKEVLINLLENARAAIPDGGTVRVEAEHVGTGVELRVVDDGSGIEPDLLLRIFEPHFSTRSTGTGLGLAIVRRLVESWLGTVEIESRRGVGTTVRVLLVPWQA